ncbi:serine/threonine protein phosphatase-like protein, partial [Euroglyphus maynei]
MNNAENLDLVCQLFERTLSNELSLVRINDFRLIYHFFGDLHGSFSDMALIRTKFWPNGSHEINDKHFVFLGDYVDRGIHGFEVIIFLFMLKTMYPANFTILRGNHEFCDMNRQSFLLEMRLKFGDEIGYQMWTRINVAFGALPYAAIICDNIFSCHGGIPKHLRSMEQIEQVPKWILNDLDENSVGFQL